MKVTCCLALLVWVCAPPLQAQVITYQLKQCELRQPHTVYLESRWSVEPPEGCGEMPEVAVSETHEPPPGPGPARMSMAPRLWFSELKLGDNKPMLIGALVTPGQRGESGCRLYLDEDGDRALADEDPIDLTREETRHQGVQLISPEIELPVTYKLRDGSQVQRNFRFRLTGSPYTYSPYLQMQILDAWEGTIKLGEKEVGIRFVDLNGDAKLCPANILGGSAPDLIQLPAAAQKDGDEYSIYQNAVPLTRYVQFEGGYYLLGIRPDGAELKVQPYRDEPAKLVISATDGHGRATRVSQVALYGENLYSVMATAKPVVEVPPGEYVVRYVVAAGKTEASFTAPRPVTLKAGETAYLAGGGRIGLQVSAATWGTGKGTTMFVSITPTNAARHSFSGTQRDPKQPPAVVEVFDSRYRRIGKANASYG